MLTIVAMTSLVVGAVGVGSIVATIVLILTVVLCFLLGVVTIILTTVSVGAVTGPMISRTTQVAGMFRTRTLAHTRLQRVDCWDLCVDWVFGCRPLALVQTLPVLLHHKVDEVRIP